MSMCASHHRHSTWTHTNAESPTQLASHHGLLPCRQFHHSPCKLGVWLQPTHHGACMAPPSHAHVAPTIRCKCKATLHAHASPTPALDGLYVNQGPSRPWRLWLDFGRSSTEPKVFAPNRRDFTLLRVGYAVPATSGPVCLSGLFVCLSPHSE